MNHQKLTCLLAGGALLLLGNSVNAQYSSTPNSAGGVDISGSGVAIGALNQSTTPALSTKGNDNITIVEFADAAAGGSVITLQTSGDTVTVIGGISATGNNGTGINVASGNYNTITLTGEGTVFGFEFGILLDSNLNTVTNNGWVDSTSESALFIASNSNTINNLATGTFSGYLSGILINQGDFNIVTNAGMVTSSHGTGLEINTSNNTVKNTGTIGGAFDGIAIVNYGDLESLTGITTGSNTVVNSGVISGGGAYGIFVEDSDGNQIQNKSTGTISGSSSGIIIDGGNGNTVTNDGQITGVNLDGIDENSSLGSKIQNNLTGNITGSNSGIVISGGGSNNIMNNGHILGQGSDGIDETNVASGNITNTAIGSIHGQVNGINLHGDAGINIKNDGNLTGKNGDGILTNDSSDLITNTAFGIITGGSDGIHLGSGTNETVTNSGRITGNNGYGILLGSQGNVIENSTGGDISGSSAGIFISTGTANMVTNDGTVSGKLDGIDETTGSLNKITNNTTGSIQGALYGIHISSGVGDIITNNGKITGQGEDGIYLNNNLDSIQNGFTGNIQGAFGGINIDGGVGNEVTNDGVINGSIAGITATNANTNLIQNNALGTISGNVYAINITNGQSNIINNEGIITGGGLGSINISGNNNVVNDNGHGVIQGKITFTGVNNTVNFNLTGLSPTAITSLNGILVGQGVNSGLPSTFVIFTLNGVTYFIDPAVVTFHGSSYQLQGGTPNQQSIGASLDSLSAIPSPGELALFNAIDHSGNVPLALDALSPAKYAIYGDLATQNTTAWVRNIDNRLNNLRDGSESVDTTGLGGDTTVALTIGYSKEGDSSKEGKQIVQTAPPQNRWGFFATADGAFYRGDGHDGVSQNGKANTGGTLLGIDGKVGGHGLLGVFAAYDNSAVSLDNFGSHATVQSYSGGLYGAYHQDGFYANTLAAYTRNNYSSDRNIVLPGFATSAGGSTHGNQYSANIDGGYDWNATQRITAGPIGGLQYVHSDVNGFGESGGVGALNIGSQNTDSLRSRVGGRVDYHLLAKANSSSAIELYAAWQHEYLDGSRTIGASFEGTGLAPFSVQTGSPKRDAAVVGASVNFSFHNRLTLFADYESQIWSESYFEQSVNGGAKISF